ncbi:MAG: hypothetical protein U0T81_05550 [Saprospiraceae bacterium]
MEKWIILFFTNEIPYKSIIDLAVGHGSHQSIRYITARGMDEQIAIFVTDTCVILSNTILWRKPIQTYRLASEVKIESVII